MADRAGGGLPFWVVSVGTILAFVGSLGVMIAVLGHVNGFGESQAGCCPAVAYEDNDCGAAGDDMTPMCTTMQGYIDGGWDVLWDCPPFPNDMQICLWVTPDSCTWNCTMAGHGWNYDTYAKGSTCALTTVSGIGLLIVVMAAVVRQRSHKISASGVDTTPARDHEQQSVNNAEGEMSPLMAKGDNTNSHTDSGASLEARRCTLAATSCFVVWVVLAVALAAIFLLVQHLNSAGADVESGVVVQYRKCALSGQCCNPPCPTPIDTCPYENAPPWTNIDVQSSPIGSIDTESGLMNYSWTPKTGFCITGNYTCSGDPTITPCPPDGTVPYDACFKNFTAQTTSSVYGFGPSCVGSDDTFIQFQYWSY